jgi:hypothetical protein
MSGSALPVLPFLAMLLVTMLLVAARADDIADRLDANRGTRPAGNDALLRIGYVVSKMIASVYGARLISYFVFLKLHELLSATAVQTVVRNQMPIFLVVLALSWLLTYSLIGVLQNGVRATQKRPPRTFFTADNLRRIGARWSPPTN